MVETVCPHDETVRMGVLVMKQWQLRVRYPVVQWQEAAGGATARKQMVNPREIVFLTCGTAIKAIDTSTTLMQCKRGLRGKNKPLSQH